MELSLHITKKEIIELKSETPTSKSIWLSLDNISLIFNYQLYPPIIIGDVKIKTTRPRFRNTINNPETRAASMKLVKPFKTVKFHSWGEVLRYQFKGIEAKENQETGTCFLVIKLGKILDSK